MFGTQLSEENKENTFTLNELIDKNYITYHLDGNHGGLYPKTNEFVEDGVPYIGANCINKGIINLNNAKYLTEERAGLLRKGIAKDRDVLFAHNATVGPVAILKTKSSKVILSTSLTAYRCNCEYILPEYLKCFMESQYYVKQYSADMSQTTRNQVPITVQKKYKFVVPTIELQNQFLEFVNKVDKLKSEMERSLKELEDNFNSLMQRSFKGELFN